MGAGEVTEARVLEELLSGTTAKPHLSEMAQCKSWGAVFLRQPAR